MVKRLFITWSPKHRLKSVDDLANALNARTYPIHYLRHEEPIFAPVKYPLQILKTLAVLYRERPKVVLVMNPPIFAPLFIFFWTQFHNTKLVISSHTGAFFSYKWRWSLFIHRFLSLKSILTITPDRISTSLVSSWGANSITLEDKIHEFPRGNSNREWNIRKQHKFKIAVINTFSGDEPIHEILKATKALPEFDFYITGDLSKGRPLLKKKPANVIFTGFLFGESYSNLLRSVDVCLVLTNEKHALLAGAIDALSIGKPLVTSNWTILREYFTLGTIFVNNTPDDIVKGIKQSINEREKLAQEMRVLKKQRKKQWMDKIKKINEMIEDRVSG